MFGEGQRRWIGEPGIVVKPRFSRREVLLGIGATAAMARGAGQGRRPMDFATLLQHGQQGGWARLPIGERVLAIGHAFLGTPYVGGTLDRVPNREACTVVLDGLDCVTFFETSLAFAHVLVGRTPSWEALVAQVARTRYREGVPNGYASRLHYTSDWILVNAARGCVEDATRAMPGAEPWTKRIDFMSAHPERYPALADASALEAVRAAEASLSRSDRWWIPRASVVKALPSLRKGDILGFTTGVAGLDCAHTGLCAGDGADARLLHASSTQKRVVLDRKIKDLLAESTSWTGLVVARPC